MKALALSKGILCKEISAAWTKVFLCASFIVLTAIGAYVRIPLPFTPVPITLQTFFVLLSGALLGRKWGMASQLGYVLLGVCGLGVFTSSASGLFYLMGPTGGYLIGFVVTSWIVGSLVKLESNPSSSRIALSLAIGSLAGIYLFGVLGLNMFLKTNLTRSIQLGILPFIPGDALKIIAASFLLRKIGGRFQ